MPKVKGKEQLCSCEKYKTYFKSIQGFGGHTLFERYNDIENIVNKRIDEKYRHFLAQPQIDGDAIHWFAKSYNEIPRRLSELQGEERNRYERIKNETLAHYKSVVDSLREQGKNSEADVLENATKFVNDDFVYCYDGRTVLGIWGMELRNESRKDSMGIITKNSFIKKKKTPVIKEPLSQEENVPSEKPITENTSESISENEERPEDLHNIRVDAGDKGDLCDQAEYSNSSGETIAIDAATPSTRLGWWSGCLNWLLLLLLLALIFMVIWCCLLKKCNFNFCGCDCEETTIVVPDSKTRPQPNPQPQPDTRVKPVPSTGDVQILLKWNNYNDLDLSCIDPSGVKIWYRKKESPTGGQLEIDMNVDGNRSNEPIENIFWATGTAPAGQYRVFLTYYAKHDNVDDTPYLITIKYGDVLKKFRGTIKKNDYKKDIEIYSFTFSNK